MSAMKRKKRCSGRTIHLFAVSSILLSMICSCSQPDAGQETPVFSDIDFASSPYKHINNGGVTEMETLPYNIDAITGATVTVEGPAVVTSIPLSMRELENRNDGLYRGLYSDSNGSFIYEGLDLYYLLGGMVDGDNGVILTEKAYTIQLKNSNRATIASFTLDEVAKAHDDDRPMLLAYGIGNADGQTVAPFVFDAANPDERSEGYIEELENDDGCLKLVYDLGSYGDNPEYTKFSNVAYIYVCEETEPGFKHTPESIQAYGASRYTDYIIAFRGSALGYELDFTVKQLENLVSYGENGEIIDGGVGYSDHYSLANTTYWYVNEYEGLDLYKLLLYLGMDDAETMGLAEARTTLISFIADDGVQARESFSVDTLSYPDAFGFYNKNAADLGDGSYIPSNADLADTGYPVLLAYGVNRYPYTITKADDGYLSGLSNSGGPMRVVFGKTQYNHANGSNQVQYLRNVIAGEDALYNTHKYTDVPEHNALAENELAILVNGEDGQALLEKTMTVGEIEDLIYGDGVEGSVKKAAQVKDLFQAESDAGYVTDIYEGVSLECFLMEVLSLPGSNGTVTFSNGVDELTVNLDLLFRTGYNTELDRDRLSPLIAFAKNGSPMVGGDGDPGYVDKIALNPSLESEPAFYSVKNDGGPLAIIIPSADPNDCDAVSVLNVTSITVDLVPDSYAHINAPYSGYLENSVRFYGDGLEQDAALTVGEIEGRQTKAKTLDFNILDAKGELSEERYRGLAIYDLLTEIGIKSNAGDVIVTASDGTSVTFSLSSIKKQTYVNYSSPEKEPLFAMLAYGAGVAAGDSMTGLPLVTADSDDGYDPAFNNGGGPIKLVMPQDAEESANAQLCLKDVVSIEVTANEINTWGHSMSGIYSEFLDYEFTFTVKNDENEWSHVFTVAEIEEMADLIVRESYSVLDIGECEGINIWKFIRRYASGIPGIDDPISITVYAEDGYKNDLLSVFYKEGFQLGVADEAGNRKPLIIAYAVNGLPLVDSESHEGYTGIAGNTAGPLRVVAETNQGASVKYVNKLVVTVPGSGLLDGYVDAGLLNTAEDDG